ncbi:MAG: GNAT family N-acetyltransferase [Actinomycetota bacterium]|nr:GNAT family N-acetyltransferase [Actinomycetota bacterium]
MLVRPAGGSLPVTEGIEVREATADDAAAYERDIGSDPAPAFRLRLSRPGSTCWLALMDTMIVHASWVETEAAWMGEVARYFVVPPGDAYIYESFTRPEVRGRGLYPTVLRTIAAALGSRGTRRLWIAAEETNRPSLRAIEKAGFAPAFGITMSRRWGRTRVAVSGEAEPRLELTRPR